MDVRLHHGVNVRSSRSREDDALKSLSQEEQECLQFFEKTIDSLEESLEENDRRRIPASNSRPARTDRPSTTHPIVSSLLARHPCPKDQDIIYLVRPEPDVVQTKEQTFSPTSPDFQSMMQNPESHFEMKPRRDPKDNLPSEYNPPLPSGSYGATDSPSSYHPTGCIPTPVLIAQQIAENQSGGISSNPPSVHRSTSQEFDNSLSSTGDNPLKYGPPISAKPSRFPANINLILGNKDHQNPSRANVNIQERRAQMLANLSGTSNPLVPEDPQLEEIRNTPTRSISFKDPSPAQSRMEALSKLGLNRNRAMSAGVSLLPFPNSTSLDPHAGAETSAKPLEAISPSKTETSAKPLAPLPTETGTKLLVPKTTETDTKLLVPPTTETGTKLLAPPTTETGTKLLAAPTTETGTKLLAAPTTETGTKLLAAPTTETGTKLLAPPTAETSTKLLASPTTETSTKLLAFPTTETSTKLLAPPTTETSTKLLAPPTTETSAKPLEAIVPLPTETSPKLPEANVTMPHQRPIQVERKPEILQTDPSKMHEDRNHQPSPSPPAVTHSRNYPPPLEDKASFSPLPEVTSLDLNSYGGKSIVVHPSVSSKNEHTAPASHEPKILPTTLANPTELNIYGGKTKVMNPAPAAVTRSHLPDILSSHINKGQTSPVKSEPLPTELNSYGGKSRTFNPCTAINRPSVSPAKSVKTPAPPPAPRPPRHSYHGATQKPVAQVLSPDHRRSSSMFRPQGITVQFSGRGATDESRREALRKLGLLKES